MMKDAEAHAGEDTKRKEEIEARNRLDGLVYSVEKTFGENKDKLDAGSSAELEAAISESKTALNGSDTEAMNNAYNRLQTASHKLAEVLYSQTGTGAGSDAGEQASSASAGAESGSSSSGGSSGGDDNVIDAEYVDVDEEKK